MSSNLCPKCQVFAVELLDKPPGALPIPNSFVSGAEISPANSCRLCSFFLATRKSNPLEPEVASSAIAAVVQLFKVPIEIAQDTSAWEFRESVLGSTLIRETSRTEDLNAFPEQWGHDEAIVGHREVRFPVADTYVVPEPWCSVEPMSDLVGPINNARIMREWLGSCLNTHSECSKGALDFVPTRLLHVTAQELGQDIRLVPTETFQQQSLPPYVALSHCWGPVDKHPITTRRHNLHDHMERIRFEQLSNTFRDAVDITRKLGLSYLWIDSLCIIQKDTEDWVRESALMAQVYESACCTLSALSSKDSTGGCHQSRNIQGPTGQFTDLELRSASGGDKVRIRVFLSGPSSWSSEYYGRYISDIFDDSSLIDPADDNYNTEDTPLRLRAWTLQERELSRRLIHFGKNQIMWECKELKATAQLPWFEESLHRAHAWKEELGLQHIVNNDLNEAKFSQQRWQHLVEDFTLRALTNGTDKLPAIGGLASQYHRLESPASVYIAGLWTEHLPSALLWKSANVGSHRYSEYVAPSWSWASLAGPVTHNIGATSIHDDFLHPTKHPKIPEFWQDDEGNQIKTAAEITLMYEDPYSRVSSGSIFCRNAYLVEVDPLPKFTRWYLADSTERYDFLKKGGRGAMNFHRDSVDDETEGLKTVVLRIERDLGCCIHWRGLVLVQVSEEKQTYRRVGLAKCIRDEFFIADHPGPQTLTII